MYNNPVNQTGFFNDDQWIAGVAIGSKIDLSQLFDSPIDYVHSLGDAGFLKSVSELQSETKESKLRLKSLFKIIVLPRIVLPAQQLSDKEFTQIVARQFGSICYQRTLPQKGSVHFTPSSPSTVIKCKDRNFLHIDSNESVSRKPLVIDSQLTKEKNVFVSRVPDDCDLSFLKDSSAIFTAGISSWKKLSHQGLLVNGCVESLGEDELQSSFMLDLFPGDWVKLTHNDSLAITDSKFEAHSFFSNVIPFYQIEKIESDKNLSSKTHFYWKSVDRFLTAYQQDPSITEKFHGSGIGFTAKFLRSKFPNIKFLPCLNEEQFMKEVL
jgi:hypothetical protein